MVAPKRKAYPSSVTREGNAAGPYAGAVVVFTGALGLSREAATDLAAQSGMTVKAGVTRLTTYLVVGDQDLTVLGGHSKSRKHRKAEEMQAAGHLIRIIGETNFKVMVGGDVK